MAAAGRSDGAWGVEQVERAEHGRGASPEGERLTGRDQQRSDPRLDPYDYVLPPDRVARYPAARREDARLLVLEGEGETLTRVSELPSLLDPGDLLVVNDTRVMPARLRLRRASGGAVEALLLAPGPGVVPAMVRPGGKLRPGEALVLEPAPPGMEEARVRLIERTAEGDWLVDVSPDPATVMEAVGRMPLPPYLDREDEPDDRQRYQTVYAGPPGAVAAPTAGLHLSEGLIAALARRGVGLARVTLHVGQGTFRKLRSEDLDAGLLHPEPYWIPEETARAVSEARARGGRVVAVGTTTVRALESAAAEHGPRPGPGRTRLFIREGFRFQVVDRLLTNFHLPRSSLLMLVSAFGGRHRVLAAYRRAVDEGFRFFSYGDAMLLDRRTG